MDAIFSVLTGILTVVFVAGSIMGFVLGCYLIGAMFR